MDARETVARAWCEILDVPAVEPDDDFFALGGDSMSAIRLVSQVESELGVVFPLESLFRDGSFKEIVEALEQSAR
ncbi:MAG: phosphopantetheine-binding protein [Sporichthyaceae bacterium]|nr:phosphopantetheine-binding protein [Sporichthyaceae bacterium]